MTTDQACLAYLAERYPAQMRETAILQRVNDSGMCDEPMTQETMLATLCRVQKLGFVDFAAGWHGKGTWGATQAGIRQWTLDGRPHVG